MYKSKYSVILFFLAGTFFFGFGYPLLFSYTGKDSWLSIILGYFLGNGLLLLINAAKSRKDNYPLKHPYIISAASFVFHIFIFTQILFIFQTFISTFLLPNTPVFFITLPIILLIYKTCINDVKVIKKLSNILLVLASFLFITLALGVTSHFDISSFLPVYTVDFLSVLKGSLLFAFFSVTPYSMLLFTSLNTKSIYLPYFISSLIILIINILITGVIGPNLILMYRYPEYILLKEIKIFNFIEKIENIVSLFWLFFLYLTLSLSALNIKKSLPYKKNNCFFILVLLFIFLFTIFNYDFYSQELFIFPYMPFIIAFLLLFLIFSIFVSYHKERH